MSQASGASGATKAASGRAGAQCVAQVDQVLPIGAEPVQQHHQLLRRAARARAHPRSIEVAMRLAPMPAAPLRACGDASNRKPASPAARPAARRGDALRAEPDRAAASRPCPCGAVRRGAGRGGGRALPAAARGYRRRPAAGRNSPRRSRRTWPGSAWTGTAPVRVQSAHMADYRAALDRLAGRGLLYPCFCTRADIQREIAAAGHAPHWPGRAALSRHLPPPGAGRARGADRRRRAACAAARHGGGAGRGAGGLSFHELGEGRLRCDPRAVRRRGAGAEGGAGQLPSVRHA